MEVGVRIIGVLLRILGVLLAPYFWLASRGKRGTVPHTDDHVLYYSATELAKKIRDGELTSEQAVKSYITRIKQVNPYLNAVVEDRFLPALDDARAVDTLLDNLRSNGRMSEVDGKPLLGVPFTVKESCSLAGLSNSVGCLEFANSKASADGAAVARVKDAGAIPLLVSNTPELCLGWESSNLLNGVTNNPYCCSRTPGGSSGGEAALVASLASPFGVASDIAGSIRVPCAFTGTYGHKPTPGIIPISGHIPSLSDPQFCRFLAVGPVARSAEDLTLLTEVMAGDRAQSLNLRTPVEWGDLTVYYMTEASTSAALPGTHPHVKKLIQQAAAYLHTECSAKISQKKFVGLEDSVEISITEFFSMKDIPNMLQDPANPKRDKSMIVELVKTMFGAGSRSLQSLGFALIHKTKLFIPESKRQFYHEKAISLAEELKSTLSTNGVLLWPAWPGAAHRHNAVFVRAAGVLYTMPFNILGMPAAVVPMGLHQGLPLAIQVIAAPHQDRLCLAVARQLEKGFGGWRPPS